jgi:WASH complex subunit strumpellin
LNLDIEHTTSTGRKIQGIIVALEDVEQFEDIDNNLQVKNFLLETRELLKQMIRTVNIKNDAMDIIDNITDFSYSWVAIKDYLEIFHESIVKDPNSVILLRAAFLKAASILDVPLVRIMAINSPDSESVAQYYSNELVSFVRMVLEIVPISVFKILHKIERIQTDQIIPIPIRLEANDLKEYAQLDLRLQLSKLTYEVSIFTEGILLMRKTLLGVIQIDPRDILEEGLRRELVRLIARALHDNLSFQDMSSQEINTKYSQLAATLDGVKRSIEYLQVNDYVFRSLCS